MSNLIARDLWEIMSDEFVMGDEIAAFVAEGAKTIPEIAQHLGHPKHEVVIWVMAMWKYGILKSTGEPDADGYYGYELDE